MLKACAMAVVGIALFGCAAVAERERAVLRGLLFIAGVLEDERQAAALRIDRVMIFLEAGATATSAEVREFALAEAKRQARRLADIRLADPLPMAAPELLDLLDLVGEAEWVDLDPAPLEAKARAALRRLPGPDALYGVPHVDREFLAGISEWGLLDVLLTAYSVEKAAVAGVDFGVTFTLADVLDFLRGHRFVVSPDGPRGEQFRDSVFLAAHVAFVASDYGRVRLREEDAPYACDYLRRVFPLVLAGRDVELIAEVMDVHRGLGIDEASSPLVAEGARFLLDTQNEDGSWGDWRAAGDGYDAVHPTWCAVMGLRDRAGIPDTPWERRIRAIFDSDR
jgi:hypothetical protein